MEEWLTGLASPRVDEEEADPVAGDQTGHRQDDVADREVEQRLKANVLGCALGDRAVTDGLARGAGRVSRL